MTEKKKGKLTLNLCIEPTYDYLMYFLALEKSMTFKVVSKNHKCSNKIYICDYPSLWSLDITKGSILPPCELEDVTDSKTLEMVISAKKKQIDRTKEEEFVMKLCYLVSGKHAFIKFIMRHTQDVFEIARIISDEYFGSGARVNIEGLRKYMHVLLTSRTKSLYLLEFKGSEELFDKHMVFMSGDTCRLKVGGVVLYKQKGIDVSDVYTYRGEKEQLVPDNFTYKPTFIITKKELSIREVFNSIRTQQSERIMSDTRKMANKYTNPIIVDDNRDADDTI